ncbi:MAG TPA: tRNA (adenosine(37)-N6)-dimethylallyltransferase MiaA [Candidatus Cloacimonas acidaminovorans]|nr:tRNA (adenosine(37)-N6)-dimethylallyltransferase MiaA [Candidatus Cloacimonas acidaminovorans]HOS07649.1 tRNA (adenosine(37)-N6)-dimethylallyltransferase MiaA [Candidatus Cloacimonas acidaminovorans]HPC50910.1 tRNA (adenosine(37)-N6)-dimethylallyltransferase MiaA [Candidatus Cloacimonas acidaminovorans]
MIPVITIEGATASGKSALAIVLAEALNTEIISADSRQVYRYLDIGTAKVTKEEQKRVKHHLIDIINPDETYNAGAFVKDASLIIEKLHSEGKIPVICGGTGLYIKALLKGLFFLPPLPQEIRQNLKQRLKEEGLAALYAELKSLDPLFADKISENDTQRILRGLEVAIGTGIPLSEHWQKQKSSCKYNAFRILIDIPRPELYQRINQRIEKMLAQGLLAEIENLFALGYDENSPGLNCLGYKEFLPYFKKEAGLEECILLAAQHQRNYAKRQVTWYRKGNFDLVISPSGITTF